MQLHVDDAFGEMAAFGEELADLAAPIALRYFRRKLQVESKADASPVTIADREIELAMRKKIRERFPDHGLFGEEHGLDKVDADKVWVIDPIDGTTSPACRPSARRSRISKEVLRKWVLSIIRFCMKGGSVVREGARAIMASVAPRVK